MYQGMPPNSFFDLIGGISEGVFSFLISDLMLCLEIISTKNGTTVHLN